MISSVRLTEALARAHQHWSTQHELAENREGVPFTIAISRQAGTFGAAVAHEVGARLSWPVYDRELLQRIADDIGVHRKLLESVDERQISWWSECIGQLLSVPDVNQTVYFRRLVETLLSLGSHGECVIVGRGATKVLPLASTLRVRLVAPLEHRILAVQKEHGITREAAAARVATTDRERDRFVTSHFQINPGDPANYDLVLNVERFSGSVCADLILAALANLRKRSVSNRTASVVG